MLIKEIEKASSVVWIFPHSDDESFFVPGILSYSSMGCGKETTAISFGGLQMYKENQRSKEILGLKDYLYLRPGGPLRDCGSPALECYQNTIAKLKSKLEEIKPSIIITFEPTNGYGIISHANTGKIVTTTLRESTLEAQLYYVINRDECFSRIRPRFKLDPLPYTDIIDLNEFCASVGKTYWEIKKDVMSAYKEASGLEDFKMFLETDKIEEFEHREFYRKVEL